MAEWNEEWNARLVALAEKMTQAQIAQVVGVTQPTVSNWINGTVPYGANLERVIEAIERLERTTETTPGTNTAEPGSSHSETGAAEEVGGPGKLAIWLRGAREAKGLTAAELARKAGVSHPTVWMIEAGKTRNPQQGTLLNLQQALEEMPPVAASVEAVEGASVPGIGSLQDFEPTDRDAWPSVAGVYVLYDITDRPVYVGKAGRIADRLREHEQKKWWIRPFVHSGAYLEIDDSTLRHQVEQALIKFLKSNAVINVQSVDRGE